MIRLLATRIITNHFSSIKNNRLLKIAFIILFISALASSNISAQTSAYHSVYQYAVPVGTRTAYLWIPPSCKYVRGIIFAAENALERNWMEDATIRQAATKENLAMLWLADGKSSIINYEIKPEAAALLDTLFYDLAIASGYREIANAPLIITGHSWNGRMAWNYPAQRPNRVIATIPIRTYPMPDSLGFSGIPLLYIVGQTTELPQYGDGRPGDRDFYWPIVRQTSAALRAKNENNLVAAVVNPGGCHMDWTPDQSKFLALFIKKACRYRLPNRKPADGNIILKKIDYTKGWLTDTGCMEADKFQPASYKKYKGNPQHAYWFFDKEMADAAVAFNGNRKEHQDQMLTFIQNNDTLPVQKNGYVFLKWMNQNNDNSFAVEGSFLHQYPEGLVNTGKPLSHTDGVVKLYHVMGPAVQWNDTTFQLQFDRQSPREIMIMADQEGDDTFYRATQGAKLSVPATLTKGTPQQISFPAIASQQENVASIELNATASSGLPVQYFVKQGPAIISGNKLMFTPVPVRSKYPVKVTVVACQWGRIVEPYYQSAERVEQTFYITKAEKK